MVFSYEVKVQELQATRIVNDYPEYEWNINGEKKKIDETGDFVWRKGFGWPKFLSIAEKIKVVEEIIISKEGQLGNHSMPAEIACELNFDYQSVPYSRSRSWSSCPEETQNTKTYWFKH